LQSERIDWPQTIGALHRQALLAGWNDADLASLVRAHASIEPLFVGWRRASGRCFTCHLVGTAGLALEFGGDKDDVIAALAHAVFNGGAFGRAGGRYRAQASEWLTEAISPAAAKLVADYAAFDWPRLVATSAVSISDSRIIRLRIANEIDDALDWPFFTEKSRASGVRELAASASIARALGWEALAARAGFVSEEMAKTPPASAKPRGASYFTAPYDYVRPVGERLRARIFRTLREGKFRP